jgi:hypothetical protein
VVCPAPEETAARAGGAGRPRSGLGRWTTAGSRSLSCSRRQPPSPAPATWAPRRRTAPRSRGRPQTHRARRTRLPGPRPGGALPSWPLLSCPPGWCALLSCPLGWCPPGWCPPGWCPPAPHLRRPRLPGTPPACLRQRPPWGLPPMPVPVGATRPSRPSWAVQDRGQARDSGRRPAARGSRRPSEPPRRPSSQRLPLRHGWQAQPQPMQRRPPGPAARVAQATQTTRAQPRTRRASVSGMCPPRSPAGRGRHQRLATAPGRPRAAPPGWPRSAGSAELERAR